MPHHLYVCPLSEEVALVAKRELREEATLRTEALKQFREWILQNGDLENCRTDANFLLRFLRVKKFSLPMAQQLLLKYLNYRRVFHKYFMDLDILDPTINKMISSGYLFMSPFRDRNGSRVAIFNVGKLDPNTHKDVDMARVHMLTYEACIIDEDTQVLGVGHFTDMAKTHAAQITVWSLNDFARIVRWGEQSFPMRHKTEHIMNTGYRWFIEAIMSILSEKMQSRFKLHDSLEDVYKHIDRQVLPKEYGGKMPMQEMIELWKAELLLKRESLLALDSMKLLSNKGIITSRNTSTNNDFKINGGVSSISGSFRKLQVD